MGEEIFQQIRWLFSGAGLELLKRILGKKDREKTSIAAANDYKSVVGRNHRALREEILGYSLRDFSDFYEFETVSLLEDIENGKVELPKRKREKLEEFFRIDRDFLDNRSSAIFDKFGLNKEDIKSFIENDYHPLYICDPLNRHDLLCYLVFYKKEGRYSQIAISNLTSSFASNGGGALNIYTFINAILECNFDYRRVRIIQAYENVWLSIKEGYFYNNNCMQTIGFGDNECMVLFRRMCEETVESAKRFSTIYT